MSWIDDERVATWIADTKQEGYLRRDWPRVQKLSAGSVALMIAALLADRWPAAAGLAVLGYIGSGVFGGAMLAYYLDSRLFVERSPGA